MTAPTEDEVRAWLEGALIVNDMRARMGGDDSGHFYRAAIALLDEARKDKERLAHLRRLFVESAESTRDRDC